MSRASLIADAGEADKFFDAHLSASPTEVADVLTRLGDAGALSFPVLDAEGCAALVVATEALAFRPAHPTIGTGNKLVRQEFDICMDVPAASAYGDFAHTLDRLFDAALARLDFPPLERPFGFNDLVVQIYTPGALGITPHLDHARYVGLVALVVVCGAARYFLCDDREGHGSREVAAPAGHLVLMVAPGFEDRRERPFHSVSDITERRISFGLRVDTRPAGDPTY